MKFPKSLDILLSRQFVQNVSNSGEVTNGASRDLKMIEFLSEALGFSYKVYSSKHRNYGDFAVGNYRLEERLYPISTYPIKITDVTFAIQQPGYVSNSLACLRPFTIEVWMAFLLSIVIVTFTKFLIFQRRVPFTTVLFYNSVTFMGEHRNWRPKTLAQKLLVHTWSVGITFLTLSYGAVILSFLSVPGRVTGITNFDELHDAVKKGKATVLKFQGDGVDLNLIASGLEKLILIGEHIQMQNTISRGSTGNFLKVIKPNVAVIGERSRLENHYRGEGYFISKDSVNFYMNTMYEVTKHGFCCMEEVNEVIHRIWGSALYKKFTDDTIFKIWLHYSSHFPTMHSRIENTFLPLSLSDLSGAFYLLITGHILALIVLICEVCNGIYNNSKKH